jgi:GalNAc-alpha-(1->4)-GalNAc-alpha-(1->3)-diNAcBac-PP-undecaprenol alpha-1,4-N-acetyl-D-galactosaminyltransferase
MKICLTNATLHCGGAERAISELANYLAAKGYDVTIFLLFKKEIFYSIDKRVKIVEPDFSRDNTNKYLYGIKTIGYIRRKMKKIDPDVILNFIFPSFFLLCTVGLRYPIYISIRNNPANKIKIDPVWFRRLTYKRAKGIIAQTNYAAKVIYEQVKHSNIKVIPNYVRAVERKNIVAQNIIITVGRLVANKGHEDLLEIFAAVKNENWQLFFAGDGPLRDSLQQKANDLGVENKTVFAGFQADIDTVLQQAKVFAFCSYSEGFPNALLEAMATPLACISYDCNAGPADVIDNGVNGFLIPVGDKNLFANKLQQLMDDENLRSSFIAEATETIKAFHPDKLAQTYLDFISAK